MPRVNHPTKLFIFLAGICLFLGTLALYEPVGGFEFINFDDDEYITANPAVRAGLTRQSIKWAFLNDHSGHWHPVTWLSHMLDVELWGMDAGRHHLTNVFIHGFNGVLAFWFALQILKAGWPAFLIAAVFVWHPLRLESVAWISERKDVLSVFWGLLALNAYLIFGRSERWIPYLLCLVATVLGLLSKPMLVSLPLLFLLLDWWPLRRFSAEKLNAPLARPEEGVRRLLLEKIPFGFASLIIADAVIRAQTVSGGLKGTAVVAIDERLAQVCVSYAAYLGKLFLPTGLGVFYPFIQFPPGVAAGALLGLIVVSGVVWRWRHYVPALLMGWGWFLISLLPVIGFVTVGGQVFADRWTYLPHLGLLIGVVAAGRLWLFKVFPDSMRAHFFIGGFVVALCLGITRTVLPVWATSETLFRHTLEVSPQNFMAHTNLGTALDLAGRLDEAGPHFEEAYRLNPTYPQALNNLGSFKARKGDLVGARDLFQKALVISHSFTQARYNLGLSLFNLGSPDRALQEWLTILADHPQAQDAEQSALFVLKRDLTRLCEAVRAGAVGFEPMLGRVREAKPGSELSSWLDQLSACAR